MQLIENTADILSLICKEANKFGAYFSFSSPFGNPDHDHDLLYHRCEELFCAAPWLRAYNMNTSVMIDGFGFILFESKEEMHIIYDQTVGDDGPTKSNPYNGKAQVYMLTCGPDGKLRTENT